MSWDLPGATFSASGSEDPRYFHQENFSSGSGTARWVLKNPPLPHADTVWLAALLPSCPSAEPLSTTGSPGEGLSPVWEPQGWRDPTCHFGAGSFPVGPGDDFWSTHGSGGGLVSGLRSSQNSRAALFQPECWSPSRVFLSGRTCVTVTCVTVSVSGLFPVGWHRRSPMELQAAVQMLEFQPHIPTSQPHHLPLSPAFLGPHGLRGTVKGPRLPLGL